jgi:hypothetical protein
MAKEAAANIQTEELARVLEAHKMKENRPDGLDPHAELDSSSSSSESEDDDLNALANDSESENSFFMKNAWEPMDDEEAMDIAFVEDEASDDELEDEMMNKSRHLLMNNSIVNEDDELSAIRLSPASKRMRKSFDCASFLAEAMDVARSHPTNSMDLADANGRRQSGQHDLLSPSATDADVDFERKYRRSQTHSPVRFLFCPQINVEGALDKTLFLSQAQSIVTAADVANQINSFALRNLLLPRDCQIFLESLARARVISFEFLYRRIPATSKSRESFTRWQPLVAWSCPKTSSESYGGVPTLSKISPLDDPNDRVIGADPHVLAGIGMNFGDSYAYYLPLPCPLPLSLPRDSTRNGKELSPPPPPSSASCSNCRYLGDDLFTQQHPHVMDLVCMFVGFGPILTRCAYIKQYYNPHPADSTGVYGDSHPSNYHVNNLYIVSKNWARSYRRSLHQLWKDSASLEWRLLQEIMSNPSITKVAMHMKSKLATLLGRNIEVQGSLQDPTVAIAILGRYKQTIDPINRELNLPPPRPPDPNRPFPANAAIRRAGYRAIEIMRVMARLETCLKQAGNTTYDLFTW